MATLAGMTPIPPRDDRSRPTPTSAFAVTLLLALLAAGCGGTYHAYDGPRLHESELALVAPATAKCYVTSVDGRPVKVGHKGRVAVRPGGRAIGVAVRWSNDFVERAVFPAKLEAGKRYQLDRFESWAAAPPSLAESVAGAIQWHFRPVADPVRAAAKGLRPHPTGHPEDRVMAIDLTEGRRTIPGVVQDLYDGPVVGSWRSDGRGPPR